MQKWLVALGAAVLLGIVVLYAVVTAPPGPRAVGEACGAEQDCGRGRMCLVAAEGSICTKGCDSARDCPAGWTCELAQQVETARGLAGGLTRICLEEH